MPQQKPTGDDEYGQLNRIEHNGQVRLLLAQVIVTKLNTAAMLAANSSTDQFHLRYKNSANTNSAPDLTQTVNQRAHAPLRDDPFDTGGHQEPNNAMPGLRTI